MYGRVPYHLFYHPMYVCMYVCMCTWICGLAITTVTAYRELMGHGHFVAWLLSIMAIHQYN